MRNPWPIEVENARILTGPMASICLDRYGAFTFLCGTTTLNVVVNSADGWELCFPPPAWEHVSVSCKHRCPTWDEMTWIASLFWDPSEVLIQFRPAEKNYRNHHPFCLHWWKPIGVELPMPPSDAVAPEATDNDRTPGDA